MSVKRLLHACAEDRLHYCHLHLCLLSQPSLHLTWDVPKYLVLRPELPVAFPLNSLGTTLSQSSAFLKLPARAFL